MGKIDQVQNGESGLSSRTKLNEAMREVETSGNAILGDGTISNPIKAKDNGTGDLFLADDGTYKDVGGFIEPIEKLDYIPQNPDQSFLRGRTFYSDEDDQLKVYTRSTVIPDVINRQVRILGQNNTGSTITKGSVVATEGISGTNPTIILPVASDLEESRSTIAIAAEDIADGASGICSVFDFVIGLDTSMFEDRDILFLSEDTAGGLTNVRPKAPNYTVPVARVVVKDSVNGVIGVSVEGFRDTDTEVNIDGTLNGIATLLQGVSFVVEGGVIYADVINSVEPTDDLPFMIDGERFLLDTTTGSGVGGAARVALTAGADENTTQANFIYCEVVGGVPTLSASTTYPFGAKAILGVCNVFDAATTDNDGVLQWQRTNNQPDNGEGDGFYNWVTARLRKLGAQYESGVAPTVTVDTVPTPNEVNITLSAGLAWQAHIQTYSGTDGTEYYIINDPDVGFRKIADLNEITQDALGNSINNTVFGVNGFGGVNSDGGTDRIYLTLPLGSYGNNATQRENAIFDRNQFAVTNVPSNLATTSFRVFRVVLRKSDDLWENVLLTETGEDFQDERGEPLGSRGGGGGGQSAVSNFSDADFTIFNSVDGSKTMMFDASGIATGNNRMLSIPDSDGTLALLELAQTFTALQSFDAGVLIDENITGSSLNGIRFGDSSTRIYQPSSNRFAVEIAGAIQLFITGAITQCKSIVSLATNTYDLGTTTNNWNNAYINKICIDNSGILGLNTGIHFGDGDTKIYEEGDDSLIVEFAGLPQWKWNAIEFGGRNTNDPVMRNTVVSNINPGFAFIGSLGSGMGLAGTNIPTITSNLTEVARFEAGRTTFTGQAVPGSNTETFSATPTFDFNDGNVHQITVTADITSWAISNELPAGSYTIYFIQDGSGGHTISDPTGIDREANESISDFDTSANAINIVNVFVMPDGTSIWSLVGTA